MQSLFQIRSFLRGLSCSKGNFTALRPSMTDLPIESTGGLMKLQALSALAPRERSGTGGPSPEASSAGLTPAAVLGCLAGTVCWWSISPRCLRTNTTCASIGSIGSLHHNDGGKIIVSVQRSFPCAELVAMPFF